MGPQVRQVTITYLTHRWIMAGWAVWLVLIVLPQVAMVGFSSESYRDLVPMATLLVDMPILFLSIMFAQQAKAQFAHSRARLIPGFAGPHLWVLALLLLSGVVLYPLLFALLCRVDTLGMLAFTTVLAASAIWTAHLNRFSVMVVALGVFISKGTPAVASWWLLGAPSYRPLHALLFVGSVGLLAGWLWRLSRLCEEMDDYQTLFQWPGARKSGTEVAEQRRIIAEKLRRNKFSSWVGDVWLARLGGYHGGTRLGLARLLRFGNQQPIELQAVSMTLILGVFTVLMARFGFQSQGPAGFGRIMVYAVFAAISPGMVGEMLAQRRPRIAGELLFPLSRKQLVSGLLSATLCSGVVMWLIMNVGLVVVVGLVEVPLTATELGMLLFMSASGAFAFCALSLRTAVWPSMIKRLAVMYAFMIVVMIPFVSWLLRHKTDGNTLYLLLALGLIALGGFALGRARRAWLNTEFS